MVDRLCVPFQGLLASSLSPKRAFFPCEKLGCKHHSKETKLKYKKNPLLSGSDLMEVSID